MCDEDTVYVETYVDVNGAALQVGDKVKFGVDEDAIGTIHEITPMDADIDDDTLRTITIPPKVWIKCNPGDGEDQRDYATGSNIASSPYEPPVYQFDDIEKVTDAQA
jgi:hypothetical protein